jgi:hypothetical protein
LVRWLTLAFAFAKLGLESASDNTAAKLTAITEFAIFMADLLAWRREGGLHLPRPAGECLLTNDDTVTRIYAAP